MLIPQFSAGLSDENRAEVSLSEKNQTTCREMHGKKFSNVLYETEFKAAQRCGFLKIFHNFKM